MTLSDLLATQDEIVEGAKERMDDDAFISWVQIRQIRAIAEKRGRALMLLIPGHCKNEVLPMCRCGANWPCPIMARVTAILTEEA